MIVKTGVMLSAAMDVPKHPELQRRALHPTRKYLAQNANSAKLKKLWERNGRDRERDKRNLFFFKKIHDRTSPGE